MTLQAGIHVTLPNLFKLILKNTLLWTIFSTILTVYRLTCNKDCFKDRATLSWDKAGGSSRFWKNYFQISIWIYTKTVIWHEKLDQHNDTSYVNCGINWHSSACVLFSWYEYKKTSVPPKEAEKEVCNTNKKNRQMCTC